MAIVLVNKDGERFPISGGGGTVQTGNPDLLINGALRVWQRYDATDSSTYTDPDGVYVADRFRCSGIGTIRPNPRGYGADVTGSITLQYWMEAADFAQLSDPVTVYFSVDGVMDSVTKAKGEILLDSGGNACIFQKTVADGTLDWVSLYPGLPARPYAQELELCYRYYQTVPDNFMDMPGGFNTNQIFVYFNGIKMRVSPTARLKGTPNLWGTGGYYVRGMPSATLVSGCTFSVDNPGTGGTVRINIDLPAGNTGSFNYNFVIASKAALEMDAEIY